MTTNMQSAETLLMTVKLIVTQAFATLHPVLAARQGRHYPLYLFIV